MQKPSKIRQQLESLVARVEACDEALRSFDRQDDEDEERADRLGSRVSLALASMNQALEQERDPTDDELDGFYKEAQGIEWEAVDAGVLAAMPH